MADANRRPGFQSGTTGRVRLHFRGGL